MSENTSISHEIEDYLKTIYLSEQKRSPVRTTTIAKRLRIEPASVTNMLQRLAGAERKTGRSVNPFRDAPLVNYEKHKGVTLTSAGRNIALEVVRRHRLLELYLHEALGYSWDEVHDEADRLEHVISDLFEERIAEYLGDPEFDPHGHPIPQKDLTIPSFNDRTLYSMSAGERGVISRVADRDPALLRYLAERDITPQTSIVVLEVALYSSTHTIQVHDKTHTLGREIAEQIFIGMTEPAE